MNTNVGWIGLGAMGSPMARQVASAGFALHAFDLDPSRALALVGAGVVPVDSAAAIATNEVIVLMAATPAQVEEILFGENGIASLLAKGTLIVVMSTIGPAAVERCAAQLSTLDVGVIDAPVSGGVTRAADGTLLIMAAGLQAHLLAVAPLLEAMAETVHVAGSIPGDGQRLKIVNQLLCGVHIAASAEALAFAERLGLDPRETWEVLQRGAAASFMFVDRGERMVASSFTDVRSAIDIFVKDMDLVLETAAAVHSPTALASEAASLFRNAHNAGLGRLDDSAVINVLRGSTRVDSDPAPPSEARRPVRS